MNRIILILLSFFITSCMTVAPVINPNKEISIFGVSSLPPQNGVWYIHSATGYQMTFRRAGSEAESHLTAVSLMQLPKLESDEVFLDYVVKRHETDKIDIGRFERLSDTTTLSALNGATCAKYHWISKDKSAKLQGGKTAVMILNNRGYICKHPKNATVGVRIEYSLRHYPETDYSTFEKNANEFFSNIKFTEF